MNYIDAHCHLGNRQFSDDREEMIKDMLDVGLNRVILICCSEHDYRRVSDLRNRILGFKLACAIHPQALRTTDTLERFDQFAEQMKLIRPDMIGETGLDYASHKHTKELQKLFFEKHLELACDMNLPVNIHSRKAVLDTQLILKKYPVKGVLHSFSGSPETAREYVKAGWMISFGASVLFPNARHPMEAVRVVPLDHLMIETDAPYQSPVIGKRHDPTDVIAIYRKIAELKGISLEELSRTTCENFDRLFRE